MDSVLQVLAPDVLTVVEEVHHVIDTGEQGPTGSQGPTGVSGPTGPPGLGTPPGGASGQFLRKQSDADFDTGWVSPGLVTGGDLSYIHSQLTPASTWIITHNLGKHPSVSVVDSSGNWVIGDVSYPSANTVTITFGAAFGGIAYLN